MKLKKFITSLLAISMVAASAVSVSAAFSYEEADGMVMIYELPTKEEVKARTPEVTAVVEKLDNAKMATVDPVYNTLYGKKTDATTGAYLYDLYRVTFTASNIGDLAVGYLQEADGLGVAGLIIEAVAASAEDKAKIVASKAKTIPAGLTSGFGFDGNVLTFQAYTTDVANPYPFFGSESLGSIAADATIQVTALFVLNAGDSVSLALNPKTVNYILLDNKVGNQVPVNYTLKTKAVVLGPDRADSFVKSIGTFDFEGLKKPFVRATVGTDSSRDFYIPTTEVVGGKTEVYGIFKYDAEDIAEGTTVTFDLMDRGLDTVYWSNTIKAE